MKSSKEKIKQKQLKGGICLMAYINEVLRQFHSVTDANDIEFRFVSFYLDNESFYATTVPQTSPNTAVDQLLKLPVREGGQVAIGTLIAKSI